MWWPLVVIAVWIGSPAQCSQPTNCSTRNDGNRISISGGVCKADYGSRFNIDSKELMGTTCVSRNRGISKLLSSRLKQALERMKQDFQQLQDLIDQEVSINENEPYGFSWRSGSLNVHRDYAKESKSNAEKMARYFNDPSLRPNSGDILSEDGRGQTVFNSQASFFGQSRYPFDNSSSKKLAEASSDSSSNKGGANAARRDPLSEYDPRTAYEQQRVLAEIRVEPEVNDGQVRSGSEVKEKNKYSEPDASLPSINLNPPNFGF